MRIRNPGQKAPDPGSATLEKCRPLYLTFLQAAAAAVCIPHSDRWCAGAAVGKHYPKQISN